MTAGRLIVKILALVLILLVLIPALSIASMIYGWGLAPQNWWWVIGGYVGIICLTTITEAIK